MDNEPEPFWAGAGEEEAIAEWKKKVSFDEKGWGRISASGRLNGSSGAWVEANVLRPLGVTRNEACITDCLNTYRASTGVEKRIGDTYLPFAARLHIPEAALEPHPSENEIVVEALKGHRERLRAELVATTPDVVVTLGNAALRVFRELIPSTSSSAPSKLSPRTDLYGAAHSIRINGKAAVWFPLAHPAAPKSYQATHERWVAKRVG
ncbi:MAG: hypothetical protein JST54_27140 [Deltaproteobacteria bacterium]|nr:hypothetical protein [Deltaproteobacteria bacterium]